MTSKEAVKWLYVYLTCDYCPMNSKCDDNNKWKCVECKEIIEKDLELLETLISVLQKFIDEEEYFVLHDNYLSLGIDGSINITQQQCDVLKSVLKLKE